MKTFPAFLAALLVPLGLVPRVTADNGRDGAAPPTDLRTTINLIRADVEAEKAELIARNIPFTTDEAVAFWPVYRAYAAELTQFRDERLAVIREYLDKYNGLSDADAKRLAPMVFDLEDRRTKLRRSYFDKLAKVIPPAKAAQFIQIDQYLESLIDIQITSTLPLIK